MQAVKAHFYLTKPEDVALWDRVFKEYEKQMQAIGEEPKTSTFLRTRWRFLENFYQENQPLSQ